MKKFLFILLIPFSLFASTLETQLVEIENTYQNTNTLQAEFVQSTYVPLLEKTITRPGRIFYEKGGKLRIEYAANPMTHYISDGTTLWILQPQTKKTETIELKNSGLPDEALRFLTELGNLRTYFKVAASGDGFKLTPKNRSIYKFLVGTFGENHYLKTLVIHNKTGNESKYYFTNLKTGMPLSEKLFIGY